MNAKKFVTDTITTANNMSAYITRTYNFNHTFYGLYLVAYNDKIHMLLIVILMITINLLHVVYMLRNYCTNTQNNKTNLKNK